MHSLVETVANQAGRHGISALCAIAICLPAAFSQVANAEEQTLEGSITAATVYRDQARIVRELKLAASQEVQQIRVVGLPSQIVSRSAFTEADAGTNVRNMRVVSRQVAADPEFKNRLATLREKQQGLQSRLNVSQHHVAAIEQDLLTIDQLVDFSATKVKQNLDRATLDVQSVSALADFAMQRRRKLGEELLKTEAEIEQLNKDIAENAQLQKQLNSANLKASYEALLTVDSPQGGTVRLVYDVGGVSWSPRYTVRSNQNDAGKRTFLLQLDASLVQDSGEPWNDVAVTLSTSTPDSQAARPLLTPLRVHAVSPGEQPTTEQSAGSVHFGRQPDWLDQEMMQRNVHLNSIANGRQVTELTSAAEVERSVAEDAGNDVADETYLLDQRMEISSHPQVQTISILAAEISGDLHHVVTPLLSSFAFREAELTNSLGRNLIAGGVDVYLDGEFVGRTTLPPTAAGQRLTIGFGTDRRIRTRRELLTREESLQGGNRRSTLKHRLVVSNFHDAPVQIRLLDRIPIAAKDGSISVSLEQESAETLSKDALYVRMQRPTGVLRWDLQIPANSFGSESYDHEYSYSIELDRQQTVVSSDLARTLGDLKFQKTNMGGGMGGGGSF